MKSGDKVRFIGDPKGSLEYGKTYTIELLNKSLGLLCLEESTCSHYIDEFESVDSSPQNSATINVQKVNEIHVTIEGTTYHLSREEAKGLMEGIREALWS